jgi:hypothetical protein
MRLMLGRPTYPSLLVSVDDSYDPTNFKFTVINGGWSGHLINGSITIDEKITSDPIENIIIHSDEQDRLRGDYNDVFVNFDNPHYVAPVPAPSDAVDWGDVWDDEVPF